MAGNGKTTVISLAKYKVVNECRSLECLSRELDQRYQILVEKTIAVPAKK